MKTLFILVCLLSSVIASAAFNPNVSCDYDGGKILIQTNNPVEVQMMPDARQPDLVMPMGVEKVLRGRCLNLCLKFEIYPHVDGQRVGENLKVELNQTSAKTADVKITTPDGVESLKCKMK